MLDRWWNDSVHPLVIKLTLENQIKCWIVSRWITNEKIFMTCVPDRYEDDFVSAFNTKVRINIEI